MQTSDSGRCCLDTASSDYAASQRSLHRRAATTIAAHESSLDETFFWKDSKECIIVAVFRIAKGTVRGRFTEFNTPTGPGC